MRITSTFAFILFAIMLTGGFVFTAFIPQAPYITFAMYLTMGFTAYIGKRLIQKKEGFKNETKRP